MLFELLSDKVIQPRLQGTTKAEIIDELLLLLDSAGVFDSESQRETARLDVLENEKLMSTGMQFGIAIPHAKTTAVSELVVCMGISQVPIDFQSVDNQPSRIFLMTLSPPDRVGPHIRFLSEVGKLLKNKKVRNALVKAETSRDILRALGAPA